MFRISQYLKMAKNSGRKRHAPHAPHCGSKGPVVIWNLTRACNLDCVHCYAASGQVSRSGELDTAQVFDTLAGLKQAGVTILILSGGEPLLRKDLESVARVAKRMGFVLSLSTNGTMITDATADMLLSAGFDYVGVSLDGIGHVHDRVRGVKGSFDKALAGLLRLKRRGVKAGARFTITRLNIEDLPDIFDLVEREDIKKLYLSHLVYSGRGEANRAEDLAPEQTRQVMEYVFDKAMEWIETGFDAQLVTGNNDADAAFLYLKLADIAPGMARAILPALIKAGGAAAGRGIANIDPLGKVHPDPLMQSVDLGAVTEKPFGAIWNNNSAKVLNELRRRPRKLNGRCGKCAWLKICGGASRTRAMMATGDFWASDPACYLTDKETEADLAHAI